MIANIINRIEYIVSMPVFLSYIFICIGIITVSCQYFQRKDEILREVYARENVRLALSKTGEIREFQIGEENLPVTTYMMAHSGWLIADKVSGGEADVRGAVHPIQPNHLIQRDTISDLGVAIESKYEADGECIFISCSVISLLQEERAIDLTYRLPLGEKDWYWEGGTRENVPIHPFQKHEGEYRQFSPPAAALFLNIFSGKKALYPYVAVSNPGAGLGIGMAIPPAMLAEHLFWYESQLLCITFRVGLSPERATPNRENVSFVVFRQDPNWGFQDVVQKYQSFYPEYFLPDSLHRGLMRICGNIQPADRMNFGLHVIGGEVYNAASPRQYEELAGAESDSARGEKIFPYLSVGQRPIFDLEEAPRDEDRVLELYQVWSTQKRFFYQSPETDNSYQSGEQLKEIIDNSNIYTPGQEPAFFAGEFLDTPAFIFPLNPNPRLFFDKSAMTIGKYTNQIYFSEVIDQLQYITGVYVGSASRMTDFYNYRKDHFRYSRYPLAYHPDSFYVCLSNNNSHVEFLDSLRWRMHTLHKKLHIGGVQPGDMAIALVGDYLEAEISPDEFQDCELLSWYRTVCGPKPVFVRWHAAISTIQEAREYWNGCIAMGYFPSFTEHLTVRTPFDSALVGLRNRYTPLLNSLNRVQWRAIPHSWISNDSLQIARFGASPQEGIYFTVFNPFPKALQRYVFDRDLIEK